MLRVLNSFGIAPVQKPLRGESQTTELVAYTLMLYVSHSNLARSASFVPTLHYRSCEKITELELHDL